MPSLRYPVAWLILLAFAHTAHGQKIYWSLDHLMGSTPVIQRANLDGSAIETIVELESFARPTDLSVDPDGGHVYWVEREPYRLRRATLQGHNIADLSLTVSPYAMRGVAVDHEGAKVYWTEPGLKRANLDGSMSEEFTPAGHGDVALDVQRGYVYWVSWTGLHRADLDGTDIIVVAKLEDVASIDVDPVSGKVYWLRYGELWRADADGTASEFLFEGVSTQDIALDWVHGKVYWADLLEQRILRADLDGDNIETVVDDLPARPTGLAMQLAECSGHGALSKGTCVCDPGWSGSDCGCATGACPSDCSGQGECVCGICVCDAGWTAEDCACSTACAGGCSGHGECQCGVCACDAGWEGEDCGCSTSDCPQDCSGNGFCDCGACVCDTGWDGPACDCVAEPCPGDCSGHGVCGCGFCTCNLGWEGEDFAQESLSPIRVFLMPDGLQYAGATHGNTLYLTPAGQRVSLAAWLVDVGSAPQAVGINAYQLLWQKEAIPLLDAQGSVTYVDNNPGKTTGDSIFLDMKRDDWLFTDHIPLPVNYAEGLEHVFGLFYASIPGMTVMPAETGHINYLCEFEFDVSSDSFGSFQLPFRLVPDEPPLSSLFNPYGGQWFPDEWQTLTLLVGESQPLVSDPPHGSIDPRQPSESDGSQVVWPMTIQFNGVADQVTAEDFEITATDGVAPTIVDVLTNEDRVTLMLDRALPPGGCTTIQHRSSDWFATLLALPGDIDGDGLTGPLDLLTLVDHFNERVPPLENWQCDINRSGSCEPLDILRLVDLLNGAASYDPWNGTVASACP